MFFHIPGIFLGKSSKTGSLSINSDGENIDSNSLATVVRQGTNQISNDSNSNRLSDDKNNIDAECKYQPECESSCFSQEELDCSISDNEENLSKDCSDSRVSQKFWMIKDNLDSLNEEVTENLTSFVLCPNQTEEETPIQVPILARKTLIHDGHISRRFTNLNYVSVFRDEYNQKVIATPINKPTKTFLMETEDKVSRSRSLEFDSKRFPNLLINDKSTDMTFLRYHNVFHFHLINQPDNRLLLI